ncbi:unnamed protein product [Brassica napus]|uniref:(rape) hypothetical protein n=1 Tax=Brassica napus TaxID=3708 RepID=A0A816KQT8_BRANA|nr:unnamed protein product [Brassica napus]
MFRFREVETPTAPSPPVLVSGKWRLLQLCRRRFCLWEVKTLSVLRRRLYVFQFIGSVLDPACDSCVVLGSWFQVVHSFVQSDEISIGSMKLSEALRYSEFDVYSGFSSGDVSRR